MPPLITAHWSLDFIIVLASLLAPIYFYFRYTFTKLQKRGFPSPSEPSFPVGNFRGVRSQPFDKLAGDIYLSSNEPILGCYFFNRPIIILRDLEMMKSILIKDFSNFRNRGFEIDTSFEPLAAHLLLMRGQEWRNLRTRLTPSFTTGKMRGMFPTLLDIGKQLNDVLDKETALPKSDVKELLTRFTTDVIASVAFGIETKTLHDPKSEFRRHFDTILNQTARVQIVNLLSLVCPKLLPILRIRFFPKEAADFFMDLVKDTMEYREKNNIVRNDFFQQLIILKNQGFVHDVDNHEKDANEATQQKFTVEVAAAQAFLFLFAGFETSSATMQYTLYELALNPQLQTELRDEINNAKASKGDSFTYETLMELQLLDRVVSETLRKYPVAAVLTRECEKDYDIPGSDLKLIPGDQIWIPTYGLHRNPEYYPNPDKFDPDRFLPERKDIIPQGAYLPFGDGPRSCIGNRFALMQTKVGLASFLSEHIVSTTSDTPKVIEFSTVAVSRPKTPIYLKITKCKKDN